MLKDFGEAVAVLRDTQTRALLGVPSQILALTRYLNFTQPKGIQLESVLLTADYVPHVLTDELRHVGINVYTHYGMTEMGLGGAIDCDAHSGQHIRETDLLVEIIDPVTERNLPDGEWGEVVFTTLTRTGMPLIRFRTGDRSRLLPGYCPCGSALRRLDRIKGRLAGDPSDCPISMPDLDEILFLFPQVMDFSAACSNGSLNLKIITFAERPPLRLNAVREALAALPVKNLRLAIEIQPQTAYTSLYTGKRRLYAS
jgi:hypothetical protein